MGQSSTQVIALCIVFSVLAVGFAGLRWWARRIKDLELKMDDFLVFAATVSPLRGLEDGGVLIGDRFYS